MPRIMINVSDDEYKSLLEKSREMHYPLSTLLRMVVTGLIAWNYKTTNSAQNIYSNNQAPISERLNGLAQTPAAPPAASSISAADRQFYDWVMAEKRDLTSEQQARYNDVSHRLSEERRNPN